MNRIALFLLSAVLATQAADTTRTSDRDAHRARIDAAITTRDYQAWKAEHDSWGGKGKMSGKVTPENFDAYARMHEAVKAGRTAEADQLRAQLGFGTGRHDGTGSGRHGEGKGARSGKGNGSHQGKGGAMGAGCNR